MAAITDHNSQSHSIPTSKTISRKLSSKVQTIHRILGQQWALLKMHHSQRCQYNLFRTKKTQRKRLTYLSLEFSFPLAWTAREHLYSHHFTGSHYSLVHRTERSLPQNCGKVAGSLLQIPESNNFMKQLTKYCFHRWFNHIYDWSLQLATAINPFRVQ